MKSNQNPQVWGSHIGTPVTPYSFRWSTQPNMVHSSSHSSISSPVLDEKHLAIQAALELEQRGDDFFDPSTESATPPPRPFLLLHACVIGVSMALIVFVEMLCVSKVSYPRKVQYTWLLVLIITKAAHRIPIWSVGDPFCPSLYYTGLRHVLTILFRCHRRKLVSALRPLDLRSKQFHVLLSQSPKTRAISWLGIATHYHSNASL